MQQIPEEGRLFQTVNKNWKEVMRHCVKDPKVIIEKKVYSEHIILKKKEHLKDELFVLTDDF